MSYSETMNAWFNESTGVVYDYKLDYPIGMVERDVNGSFTKLDKDTYIIDRVINIPQFKLYE
jgi:hypothetical protein